ncbi:MAG: hypothetical protein EWV53_11300 [Microcystis panniformis Mp_MB_F_20051200_S9]|uniref:Uncharacterized protein n=1 Tax=Microcystis panniformis Mp_MB_F_20051200_S9 TaxID=2486223 RepID=A0A552PYA0_9CHRO|nr:MAG: hypothetical protein EWV87_22390 [Microcystis panniformis Mp_GB_SS_20050300_S99]TRV43381.1 MAG: hypothetical protein EWV42_23585 [Microcystis panniformis Mp_GB_SS_20050300_S99D]TRV48637.1 MAG: hypothetical protein EWV43_09980 [Microcystis panniformis Mp_MB_F_20080800_S26D]TRV54200.1 MAG: hypothetical protein EWV69_22705 [Microcystis panniformis Mp_MB_F_20080800_S26]TRV61967.1 MAG: hypothetical protein EWV53_11300 [Microcystis panniformis Mp_MB_F_20051200_S9]TRV69240.1 MAG: hypothetical
MTELLSAIVLVTLAIQEFVKSGTGDLAKRFTAEAVAKIPVLWGKIRGLFGLCYAMDGGYKGWNLYVERHLAIFVNCF